VLDEANARRFAEAMRLKFTGLIGLLVAAARIEQPKNEKVLSILEKLARSDFRMSSDLYLWAQEEIEWFKKWSK